MKDLLTTIGIAIVAGAVAGLVVVWLMPDAPAAQNIGSPVGTTFNTAKVAAINLSPQSSAASSTSLFNGDASDRYVTDAFATCTGLTTSFGTDALGVATLKFFAGTSTTAAPGASIADRSFNAMNVSLGTSTAYNYVATTTYTVPWGRIWTTQTYLIFQSNATSSGMTCNVGVHYLQS